MKKILSVLLSILIVFSIFSFSAFSAKSGDFTYELSGGKAVITAYSGTDSTLTVPATLGGYQVYAIGEGAFRNNQKLTSVTVAEGICEIRANAFNGCSSLGTIALPATLIRFGENAILGTAYYNDTSNWTIRPDSLTGGNISMGGGMDSVPMEFLKANVLKYIYLGTVLVKCIVEGSYSVKYSTTVIADSAFEGQSGLKSISTSAKLLAIGARAFKDCTSLQSFTLRSEAAIYEDAFFNSGLYNDAANWKGDVFVIGTRAILPREDLQELNIGDGVTYLSSGSIGNRNAYIPESVTKIDLDAFSGNSSVIYGYSGTYAEAFALGNGFTFVDLDDIYSGDLDFDGVLTTNDYAFLRESVTCEHALTKYERMAGDLNMDGTVDAFDVLRLQILINDKTATTKGDVNGDGQINRNDYTFLANVVRCNCRGIGENFLVRSDLNGDGVIDAFDVLALDIYLHKKGNM